MKEKFNGYQLFDGRFVVIASMHKKEEVIAPVLEKELGVRCFTIPHFNTDVFGTFSGEVDRIHSPIETLKMKALAALDLCEADIVVASEGSFGPHPSSFFVPANEEYVIFLDKKHNLEVVGRYLTFNTNFNQENINTFSDLEEFKTLIGYPQHGIIIKVKDNSEGVELVYKDFESTEVLDTTVINAIENKQKVVAQTDMRALHNPTRMLAIEQATINLIKNISVACPSCKTLGFTITEVIPGLPCESCRFPTKSSKSYIYACKACNYKEVRPREDILFEDPTFCDFCNP